MEKFGNEILLITGRQSFLQSEHWDRLCLHLQDAGIKWRQYIIDHEPSPALIDTCVQQFKSDNLQLIVAIGGGSVLDAGKAISAMLEQEGSVRDYLEGVGTKKPKGQKVPFIAVPTTAGTGSEATKNAVISEVGKNGFKRSLRHDRFVPDVALVDPELMQNTPRQITAQSGMDAFTQLLESYLSTNANPFTDSLALEALRLIRDHLPVVVNDDPTNLEARSAIAYAALISGITLANAGLGLVHGFASSVGGYIDIPHGLVCGRLMAPANRFTLEKLVSSGANPGALAKYGRIGKIFSRYSGKSDEFNAGFLIDKIEEWTEVFELKNFTDYGLRNKDIEPIVIQTSNKYNPIALEPDEMGVVLSKAL
jgi:alcohol dehydrogenase class IV